MRLDRMMAIIVTLIRRTRVQAKELADMFDVSVRTIYRDIEAINQAGIPIITYQGANGGISIAEGYRLDKSVLTNNELAAIVTALKSVSTSYAGFNNQILLEKLKSTVPPAHLESFNLMTQQVLIDLSPWGNDSGLKEKNTLLKQAIDALKTVSFEYCNAKGELSSREVEPHTLVLKGQKWYLYAYCRIRDSFRLFKLSRMKNVQVNDAGFSRRETNLEELPWDKEWHRSQNVVHIVLGINPEVRILAEEWFGVENVLPDGNGRFTVALSFPEDDWLYGFILSFGSHVEVLEPEHLRDKIRNTAREILAIYDD
ncbi:Predicted DNA-binding transcriptional regulator YafY, contains an HTH and WYL domains [Desulfotomaculum arcticum]|uniref:Predicted DNA-binding transcriptional regulator YafY, contains an HTH and WYL domains n=2 Tax=Desulfotruncus TaxID=2867377 RepID=A0A1I2VUU9_9FIRM|nr:Predicted DNA-binding transcriptional regulator YafY, contains an HTH and WYL domains [Desulfotomaculum arcticum] [Desulfotruncus arcticus DSM 17038]